MPVHHCRRSFLRGGFALVLAAYASACRPQTAATSTAPAPSATPDLPAASPTSAMVGSYPIPQNTEPYPISEVAPVETISPYPAPTTNPATPVPSRSLFEGQRALEHAAAQMQWIPRDTGSEGWKQCGDYIAAQFATFGWAVEEQRFSYQNVECRNIIAKRGSGPGIIIGAHYDARRRADRDPDPSKQNDAVPAANDGASGVAVLLELARVLKPEELGCEVWLTAFDAEDNGDLDGWEWIVGSTQLANSLTTAPEAVVVVDMIGDAAQQLYYEQTSDGEIREGVWRVANELGYPSFIPEAKYAVIDDHTPFLQRGYRAIDIIDFDYPYWHTTQDTLDKISAESLEAVGKTLEEWLLRGRPGV